MVENLESRCLWGVISRKILYDLDKKGGSNCMRNPIPVINQATPFLRGGLCDFCKSSNINLWQPD